MNKREARKLAHKFAYLVMENAIADGRLHGAMDQRGLDDVDQDRVMSAFDEMTQAHFERAGGPTVTQGDVL